jgi:hypothetical protein
MIEGDWTVEDGSAQLGTQDGQAFATVDTSSPEADLRVRFDTAAGGAGVVFRFADARNFWSVWAAEAYGAWVVYRSVDGRSEQVAQAPWSLTPGPANVEIRMDGRTIRVLIDDRQVAALIDRAGAEASARRVGFYSTGSTSAVDARWSELVVGEFDE